MLSLSIWTPPRKTQSMLPYPRRPVDLRTVDAGFGLPSSVDPDPFGVLELERAGLAIKEAGTRQRASSDAFEYRPSPTSPAFRLSLQSHDGNTRRNSRRSSHRSMKSVDHGTQTADLPPPVAEEEESTALPDSDAVARESYIAAPAPAYHSPIQSHPEAAEYRQSIVGSDLVDSPVKEDDEEDDEEEVHLPDSNQTTVIETGVPIAVVAESLHSPIIAKAKLVNIQRRGPAAPAVPSRNPMRAVRTQAVQAIDDDSSSTYSLSPTGSGFDEDGGSPKPWSEQTSILDTESLRHKGEEGGSRRASLDLRSPDIRSRLGSQDAGSPLSREVVDEVVPPTKADGLILEQQEALAVDAQVEEAPKANIEDLTAETEAWKDEDEFHSVPPSPIHTQTPVH